jgi:hypothetical protein
MTLVGAVGGRPSSAVLINGPRQGRGGQSLPRPPRRVFVGAPIKGCAAPPQARRLTALATRRSGGGPRHFLGGPPLGGRGCERTWPQGARVVGWWGGGVVCVISQAGRPSAAGYTGASAPRRLPLHVGHPAHASPHAEGRPPGAGPPRVVQPGWLCGLWPAGRGAAGTFTLGATANSSPAARARPPGGLAQGPRRSSPPELARVTTGPPGGGRG